MSSISPRSDMMWYEPSARYSRMIVCVPSACRYRSSVWESVAFFSASTAASPRQTNRYGASGSLSSYTIASPQSEGAQQLVLRGAGTGGFGELVQAPAGLVEQVHGLAEQRVPLRGRHRPLHQVPDDLDHRSAQPGPPLLGSPGDPRE